MGAILTSFGQFMPYVFVLIVVGIIWDHVVRGFKGWL